jgi:ELWxxDGT repeat protein
MIPGGTLYFSADDGVHGAELWRTNGRHTSMVKDINPLGPSNPKYLTAFNGSVFFSANDGYHGDELWKSDGSEKGTYMVMDLKWGSPSSQPSFITVFKGALFFAASDSELSSKQNSRLRGGWKGMQMWTSDGTKSGTRRAFDQTMNDLDVDVEAMDLDWPPKFGVFDNSLYYSGNLGTGAAQMPAGGVVGDNDQVKRGVEQALAVVDVDTPPEGTLEVKLSCQKCYLSLGKVDGLSFLIGDGFEDEILEINATARALNEAFRSLQYKGKFGLNGWDKIEVEVRDKPLECEGNASKLWLAESAAPNASISEDISEYYSRAHDEQRLANLSFCDFGNMNIVGGAIDIYISSVNHAPVVDVNLPYEGTGLTLRKSDSISTEQGFWKEIPDSSFVLSDPDMNETQSRDTYDIAGEPPLTVTIEADHGVFTLGTLKNLAFVEGDGVEDRVVTFMAAVADANNAFRGLQYLCSEESEKPCFAGTHDGLRVTVDDNGFSGRGGSMTASGFLPISVLVPSEDVAEETLMDRLEGCYDLPQGATVEALAAGSLDEAAYEAARIDGCECHESCNSCGYHKNPVNANACITCAEGYEYFYVELLDGTGRCTVESDYDFYPAGGISWKDTNQLYHGEKEAEATELIGDGDVWDD